MVIKYSVKELEDISFIIYSIDLSRYNNLVSIWSCFCCVDYLLIWFFIYIFRLFNWCSLWVPLLYLNMWSKHGSKLLVYPMKISKLLNDFVLLSFYLYTQWKLVNYWMPWFWTRMLQINSVRTSHYNRKLINLCTGVSVIIFFT